MKFLNTFVLFLLFSLPVFGADSGAVSEGKQVWAGHKVMLADAVTDSTLTGNVTLTTASTHTQRMDPAGSSRNVTLHANCNYAGNRFKFINAADAAENLVIKDSAATTIVTISENQAGEVFYSDTLGAWVGYTYTNSASGLLAADGSVLGATGQAQDFGTNGIKADAITSSSGTTTTFNFVLTDNLADAMNVKEASNSYLKFVTTNSAEKIALGVDLDLPAARSFTMLDNSSAALTIKEGANAYLTFITTNSGEKIQLGKDLDLPAARSFTMLDNSATALVIKEGSNAYMSFITTDSGEKVTVSKALTVANKFVSTPASVQDMSTAGTITLPAAGFTQRLTASGGAATGVILTAGSTDGQMLILINADATNDITFAASGTSNVAGGTSAKVTHLWSTLLIWDSTTSLWYASKQ